MSKGIRLEVSIGIRQEVIIIEKLKLGEMEQKFAELIWKLAPVSTRTLTEECSKAFSWKRTTTYTMLKRLCDRNIFENDGGTVKIIMSKEDFFAAQGEEFVNETFGGSLPMFLAAFTRRKKLTRNEIEEIQKMIDSHHEGED